MITDESYSCSLFSNRLNVILPETFTEMAAEKADSMFPYEDRPQVIMENEEGTIFCTFSLLKEKSLSSSQVKAAIHSAASIVSSLYPLSQPGEPEIIELPEGICGWFEFKTPKDDIEIHNYMYVFPVDGYMMLGSLGCTMGNKVHEQQLSDIMKSLRIPRKKWSASGGWV